jgi:hypothetical protein|nr:MAG TPA: hypothetical protein [Caudoviricetes sp.]
MFDTIWKIKREGNGYRITLDPSSFSYDSYPKQDREWTNDNIEELMKEARICTKAHIESFDHYGKFKEYGSIFFDVDEKVIMDIVEEIIKYEKGIQEVKEEDVKEKPYVDLSYPERFLFLLLLIIILAIILWDIVILWEWFFS